MKQWMLTLVAAIMLFVTALPATAQTIETARTTSNAAKPWTITFNTDVATKTVTANSVYIQNKAKEKIDALITVEGASITIKPKKIYTKNEAYILVITKAVTNTKNISLTNETHMPFIYTGSTDAIEHVETTHSSIVTNVIAHASSNVFSVVVTAKNQHYTLKYNEGNVYSSGILQLAKGDTLTVKAYDVSNKLIETKEIKVQ